MYRSFRSSLVAFATCLWVGCPAIAAETVTYAYDAQGRLVSAVHSGTGPNAGLDIENRYDLAGNRTTQTAAGSKNMGQQVIVVPINGFTIIPVNP